METTNDDELSYVWEKWQERTKLCEQMEAEMYNAVKPIVKEWLGDVLNLDDTKQLKSSSALTASKLGEHYQNFKKGQLSSRIKDITRLLQTKAGLKGKFTPEQIEKWHIDEPLLRQITKCLIEEIPTSKLAEVMGFQFIYLLVALVKTLVEQKKADTNFNEFFKETTKLEPSMLEQRKNEIVEKVLNLYQTQNQSVVANEMDLSCLNSILSYLGQQEFSIPSDEDRKKIRKAVASALETQLSKDKFPNCVSTQ